MDDTKGNSVLDPLSERELDILRLIEGGCTNREIGQKLVLSLETIKWYNKQIYSKLGVHNRTQAVAAAKAAGLLGAPSEELEKPKFVPPHNLPAQVTSFIGRQREIAEVQGLLATNRLLTLSGAPGTGKTRLALQVAYRVLDLFEDGVFFVELAPISDPQFVPSTIAQVFDLGEYGARSTVENLKLYLGSKRLLLLLDNYEQIIETAPLVGDLLSAAPGLKVLVTSRQVLQVYGEQEYLVPPLAVPDLRNLENISTLSQYEAVELFCQRAQAVSSDFSITEGNAAVVAEICVRLDGLPLAIELAAARCKMLTEQMIRSRLESRLETLTGGARDLPSRLQTLRGTIDWSYDLLVEGEKVVFARLSVFQGGRTIKAAQAVCASGLSISVVDGLESLLNKSLIYKGVSLVGEPRFLMLETIHEYAREKLVESGEAKKFQHKHAEYFTAIAEQAETKLSEGNQRYWFTLLRTEHDNLRTALAYTLRSGEGALGLRIVGALREFWFYSGHAVEGAEWIERALDSADDVSPGLRAKAFNALGTLSFILGDYERGKQFNQNALAIYRELGDDVNSAWAKVFLAQHYEGSQSELDKGLELIEEALASFRVLDDRPGVIRALNLAGEFLRLKGDYDRARTVYEESLALCRASGNRLREAYAVGNLGSVFQYQGNHEQAEMLFKRALVLASEHSANFVNGIGLALLSGPVASQGYPLRAAQLLGASDSLLKAMGLDPNPSDQLEIDRYEAAVREQLSEQDFESAWAKGQAMSLEQANAFALEEQTENG